MNDTSRKVLRGGFLGAAVNGVGAAFLAGVLGGLLGLASPPSWLFPDVSALAAWAAFTFAVCAFFPGALIGALVGASRAGSAPSADLGTSTELEMARLRNRMEELEAKANNEAIQRKKES